MAYENIKFYKSNMAVYNSYFFLFDYTQRILTQKLSNGTIGFQYPIDIPISFQSYILEDVECLQHDGFSFWTLQKFTDSTGLLIRRWCIDNYICRLQAQFPLVNDQFRTYDADTLAIEYYTTTLTYDLEDGATVMYIEEYADSVVFKDTVIGIGYNKFSERELVTVSGVDRQEIFLATPPLRNYFSKDPITIVSSIFLFNKYAHNDNTQGSLIRLNPYVGTELSYETDSEYLSISASKFCRLKGVLHNHPDVHTLAYTKDTTLRLRNMSDMYRYDASIRGDDYFTAEDYTLPDDTKWVISKGDPVILDNRLYCSTAGAGHDKLNSTYHLIGDFSVQISGSLGYSTVFSGTGVTKYVSQYMGIEFPEDGLNYALGLKYSTDFSQSIDADNLVAHYKLEGNYIDSSINGLDGTSVGALEPVPGITGIENKACSFEDASGIVVPSNTLLDSCTVADFSILFWLKLNFLTPDGSWRIITHKGAVNTDRTFAIFIQPGTTSLAFQISTVSSYSTGFITSELPTHQWVHVAYVKRGNTLNAYIDGLLDSSVELPTVTQNTGDLHIGASPWHDTMPIYVSNYKLYSKAVSSKDIQYIRLTEASYIYPPEDNTLICSTVHDAVMDYTVLASGIVQDRDFKFRLVRNSNNLHFAYKTVSSGIDDLLWTDLTSVTVPTSECLISLGVISDLITVHDAYFDNFLYEYGNLSYPLVVGKFYGIMGMDNIKTDQSTVLTIYDIDIEGDSVYRLQKEATYYGSDISWLTYNYQISPIRSFIDFITIDSDTHILPATGRNTTPVRSVTLDQYGQGVVNRPVTFVDDDPVGFMTTGVVYTDIFYNTGKADTAYTSGTSLRVVDIIASVTQLD